jgi:hypothetical protein
VHTLLVLDLLLHVLDGVGGFDLEGNGLAGQSLHEDLHDVGGGLKGSYGRWMRRWPEQSRS